MQYFCFLFFLASDYQQHHFYQQEVAKSTASQSKASRKHPTKNPTQEKQEKVKRKSDLPQQTTRYGRDVGETGDGKVYITRQLHNIF